MCYSLFVHGKGPGLMPEELCSCEDQSGVLAMCEKAVSMGYYQFVVVLG